MVTQDQWERLKSLFVGGMQLRPDEIDGYVAEEPNLDSGMRHELLRLLQAHHTAPGEPFSSPMDAGEAGFIGDRFRVIEKLGSGGFGDVYRVHDNERNVEVALKRLRYVAPSALAQFKKEFRALTQFHHPGVARLFELIHDTGEYLITMELLPGQDLVEFCRPFGVLDPKRLTGCMLQLAEALQALHLAGVLHRDVKASNVRVTLGDRVVLLDFGLVRELDAIDLSQTLSGTPVYMAPEQLKDGSTSEATDWYSLGVLLNVAISGRAPFDGGVLQILEQKMNPGALALPMDPRVDSSILELCSLLISPDPALRPSGPEVLERLRQAEPRLEPTQSDGISNSGFLHRERELAALGAAFGQTRLGQPVAVHVRGASGLGKSALLDQFISRLRDQHNDLILLRGRCYERESCPFKALDELVDALSRALALLPGAVLATVLPRNFSLLLRMFPALGRVGLGQLPALEILDSAEMRMRAFASLRELLGRLAERAPLVLVIDDMHWGDMDGLQFLSRLCNGPDAPPLLLVAAYRAGDVPAGEIHDLLLLDGSAVLGGTQIIELTEFTVQESLQMARALLGPAARSELVESVAAESEGNPFFLQEMSRCYFDSPDMPTLKITSLVKRRTNALPASALTLLTHIAVAGRPIEVATLQSAISDGGQFWKDFEILRASRLIRTQQSGPNRNACEIYHDRIRETLIAGLEADHLLQSHRRLAEAIMHYHPDESEWLAEHFHKAGDNELSLRYRLEAAGKAAAALAFDRAARLYRESLALGSPAATDTCAIYRRLGEALAQAGRGAEAAEAFIRARELASPSDQVELTRLAADQYLRTGYFPEGLAQFRDLLQRLGIRWPRSTAFTIASVVALRWKQGVRDFLRKGGETSVRPETQLTTTETQRLEALWLAAVGLSMVDPIRSAYFSTLHYAIAVRTGDAYRRSLAFAAEASQCSHTAKAAASALPLHHLARAQYWADRSGEPHAVGMVSVMRGIVYWLNGDWRRAIEQSDNAVEYLRTRCSGVQWEIQTAETIAFVARNVIGELGENDRTLRKKVAEAAERGDQYGKLSLSILGCSYLADLAADRPEAARQRLRSDLGQWRYEDYNLQRANTLFGEINVALYSGDLLEVRALVAREWPLLERAQVLRLPTVGAFGLADRGRLWVASAVGCSGREQSQLLALAERDARRIEKMGTAWGEGLALVIRAGVAATRRNRRLAVELLLRAEAELTKCDMALWLVAVRARKVALGLEGTDGPASVYVRDWVRSQQVRNPGRIIEGLCPGDWEAITPPPPRHAPDQSRI